MVVQRETDTPTFERTTSRLGAVAAITGAVLLLVGTILHPSGADPNDLLAAFSEYAAAPMWVASHLVQLAGLGLMVMAVVLLSRLLEAGRGAAWARVGAAGAVAGLATGAALQAVDGVALKVMVDAWAAASGSAKEMLFHAAFGVRQVEVGLAAMVSLLLGLTAAAYGLALLSDGVAPRWLGWLAIMTGLFTAGAGLVMAYAGFSGLAMGISLPASLLLLVWIVAVGAWMWRWQA